MFLETTLHVFINFIELSSRQQLCTVSRDAHMARHFNPRLCSASIMLCQLPPQILNTSSPSFHLALHIIKSIYEILALPPCFILIAIGFITKYIALGSPGSFLPGSSRVFHLFFFSFVSQVSCNLVLITSISQIFTSTLSLCIR
ncbi:hypothetical protein CPB83DRAFT_854103 [Crepidotus variabilis]|uniref:Uncharacterized protein n=1 Tax=Crepidotus variabilis TaxID=179855 RepID=A0A9P6EH93_9AGAR|nr:hypothetical protein CPB83DRAFT_854103 [Crepidotus variabilis]